MLLFLLLLGPLFKRLFESSEFELAKYNYSVFFLWLFSLVVCLRFFWAPKSDIWKGDSSRPYTLYVKKKGSLVWQFNFFVSFNFCNFSYGVWFSFIFDLICRVSTAKFFSEVWFSIKFCTQCLNFYLSKVEVFGVGSLIQINTALSQLLHFVAIKKL